MTSFYTEQELQELGLKHCGKNVLLSRKASIYGASRISIGDNSRIDDFCILSGKITIGRNVHISAYCALYGGDTGIVIKDYSGCSARCTLYAESDDYSGTYMVNSTLPSQFRNVDCRMVTLEKYVQIGAACTVLPGVHVGEGSAVGCMSLLTKSLEPWGIYVGIPCKRIKDRSKRLLELEKEYLKNDETT